MSTMEHMDESETKKAFFCMKFWYKKLIACHTFPFKAFLDIGLASKNTILALETVTLKNP